MGYLRAQTYKNKFGFALPCNICDLPFLINKQFSWNELSLRQSLEEFLWLKFSARVNCPVFGEISGTGKKALGVIFAINIYCADFIVYKNEVIIQFNDKITTDRSVYSPIKYMGKFLSIIGLTSSMTSITSLFSLFAPWLKRYSLWISGVIL